MCASAKKVAKHTEKERRNRNVFQGKQQHRKKRLNLEFDKYSPLNYHKILSFIDFSRSDECVFRLLHNIFPSSTRKSQMIFNL